MRLDAEARSAHEDCALLAVEPPAGGTIGVQKSETVGAKAIGEAIDPCLVACEEGLAVASPAHEVQHRRTASWIAAAEFVVEDAGGGEAGVPIHAQEVPRYGHRVGLLRRASRQQQHRSERQ